MPQNAPIAMGRRKVKSFRDGPTRIKTVGAYTIRNQNNSNKDDKNLGCYKWGGGDEWTIITPHHKHICTY